MTRGTGGKSRKTTPYSRLRPPIEKGIERKIAVVCFSVVLILSTIAPVGPFVGTAEAATGSATVDIRNPASGEVTDHNTTVAVGDGTSGSLETIRINYTGTGVNASSAFGADLLINGTAVAFTSSRSDDFVNLTLNNTYSINGSEQITFVARDVQNPPNAGTYDANVELVNGSATFDAYTTQLDVVQGGYINGTVTNGSGGAVSGASVTVRNETTDEFVTGSQTAGDGSYSVNVPADTYTVDYTAAGHETVQRTVTVSTGAENTTNVTLDETGVVSGTVTATNGSGISSINVIAYDPDEGAVENHTTTDGSGGYSLQVPTGTYDVIATDPTDDFEDAFEVGVGVQSGGTVQQNFTMQEVPGTGTIEGTVVNASNTSETLGGATVGAVDATFTNFNQTTADADGSFSLQVPAGTYQVRGSNVPGHAPNRVTDVTVEEGVTTEVTIALPEPATITGTVTNASGTVQGAFVVAADQDSDQTFFTTTDATGGYERAVPPGDYTVTVFAQGESARSKSVQVNASETKSADLELKEVSIEHTSLEIRNDSNVQSGNVSLSADVQSGIMLIQLLNDNTNTPTGMPNDLESLGVDRDTEFVINITATNYTPSSLMWGARDVSWSTAENESVQNGTDITITTKAVDLQGVDPSQDPGNITIGPLMTRSPSDVTWPSGADDRADMGWNETVYFGLFDMGTAPPTVRESLDGMTVTTNAQTFATPRVTNNSLQVWVAGPSTTTEGANHTGFYQATIPDSQLDEWGVDDPVTDLEALYKGQQRDFSVTETSDGVRIVIEDIDYSAGVVEVEPSPSAGAGDDDDGGVGGGSPGEATFVEGQARVDFGAGSSLRAVEVISPGTTGRLNVKHLGVRFENVPEPGTPVVRGMDIQAPDPSSGTATVQITLSQEAVDGHTASPEGMTIQRYDAPTGEWETLDTTATEISDGVLFEAETSEFSVFVVSHQEEDTQSEETTPTPTSSSTATPTPTSPSTATQGASPTPGAAQTTPEQGTTTATAAGTDAPAADGTTTGGTAAGERTPTAGSGPGFGAVVALLALLAVALLTRRPA